MSYDERPTFEHQPVLLDEVLRLLDPARGEVFVDCTLGGAGHAQAVLDRMSPSGRLVGIDQDEVALAAARERLLNYGDRVQLVHANFADLDRVLERCGTTWVDGILLDLGVSSPQLDIAERGFSYHRDAPLDMRMNQQADVDAAKLVNELSQAQLTKILREYGEERWAARIAQFIVRAREQSPLRTTGELVDLVKAAVPAKARQDGPHPARRTFQALRIAVNRELDVLATVLPKAVSVLREGGRLVVISFHSLEDRIVKSFFKEAENPCTCPPQWPACACGLKPTLRVLTRRPVTASDVEIERNPRARSAKVRAAERVLSPGESE